MTNPEPRHVLTMTYCGPTNTRGARWHVTWEGWPSHDRRKAGKYLPYDYAAAREAQMTAAAMAYCAWLGKMPGDDEKRTYLPDAVTYGSLSPDSWVIMLRAVDQRYA
jgi:hypothetical protein